VAHGHQALHKKGENMSKQSSKSFAWIKQLWNDEEGQDIAEYSVMLAVILVIVVGTVRMIGSNANNVFSQVGSSLQ
jgi:Flp pilus assembly pilin Flp